MKLLCAVVCLLIFSGSLFSQEFVKNSKVYFKDKSIVKGDFYYYPTIPNLVQIMDSTGKKSDYKVWDIDYVEGRNSLIRNINYKGADKLFESIVEGEKLSLYKTNENNKVMLYILKDDLLSWLECGSMEFEKDSKRFSKEITTYKRILKYAMNDNAELASKVDHIKCLEKEVTQLVTDYNKGRISYFKNKETEIIDRKPNWKIYSSYSSYSGSPGFIPYSTHKSLVGAPNTVFYTTSGAFGQIGMEYFPYEGSNYSFRLGLEYGKFYNRKNPNPSNDWTIDQFNKSAFQYVNINISYYYDFYRTPKSNMYIGIRVLDIGKVWSTIRNAVVFAPRLSPGIGYEHHITKQIDVFGELNHLFLINNFPHNYSFGLTYVL